MALESFEDDCLIVRCFLLIDLQKILVYLVIVYCSQCADLLRFSLSLHYRGITSSMYFQLGILYILRSMSELRRRLSFLAPYSIEIIQKVNKNWKKNILIILSQLIQNMYPGFAKNRCGFCPQLMESTDSAKDTFSHLEYKIQMKLFGIKTLISHYNPCLIAVLPADTTRFMPAYFLVLIDIWRGVCCEGIVYIVCTYNFKIR